MSLRQQAAILAAAIEGKALKRRYRLSDVWTEFKPTHNMEFNFKEYEYAVVEPSRVLHQYIVKTDAGGYFLTSFFYPDAESAQSNVSSDVVVECAAWTRIEVPA